MSPLTSILARCQCYHRELPTTLYCISRASLQTMRQAHSQVVSAFEDFIIRLLVERLMSAHTEIEELL